MKTSDFNFHLPEHLIAQNPIDDRDASRLLHLSGSNFTDRTFSDLPKLLNNGDLLILNNTKVMPARLHGVKTSGGKIEILIERVIDEFSFFAQVKFSGKLRADNELLISNTIRMKVIDREKGFFLIRSDEPIHEVMSAQGQIPLPPYIKRDPNIQDTQRYQTVFASERGAVAAPTAGLHFTETVFSELRQRGIDIGFLTLHVGAGTFMPLREEQILEKKLHQEYFSVSSSLCHQIKQAHLKSGRIIAVGTTVTRALESLMMSGGLRDYKGFTDIFITPGFEFKIVDAMITNFHLPASSLMMLVSAFLNKETILKSYDHAIEKGYHFYSYGDVMYIEGK
ncbi:tRNA preQ1(34) S-adenosylmethionine ribosyltransferase-isomerase QueA [Gammaproteobacteria bacterium]|nr:tRNA preQ1(34) S-adenosylmethionine ribosyltransferase-isomerase QueA [Gammaproteobacteria bacterium]